jgi:hypothetical protein
MSKSPLTLVMKVSSVSEDVIAARNALSLPLHKNFSLWPRIT